MAESNAGSQEEDMDTAIENSWKTRMEQLFLDVATLSEGLKDIGSIKGLVASFKETEEKAKKTAEEVTLLQGRAITNEAVIKTHSDTLQDLESAATSTSTDITDIKKDVHSNAGDIKELLRKVEELTQEVITLKSNQVEIVVNIESTIEDRIKERLDRENRKRNVVIDGIPEFQGQNLLKGVKDMLHQVGLSIRISDIAFARRVGKKGRNPRPVVVSFKQKDLRDKVMAHRNAIKKKDDYSEFWINADLTDELKDHATGGRFFVPRPPGGAYQTYQYIGVNRTGSKPLLFKTGFTRTGFNKNRFYSKPISPDRFHSKQVLRMYNSRPTPVLLKH